PAGRAGPNASTGQVRACPPAGPDQPPRNSRQAASTSAGSANSSYATWATSVAASSVVSSARGVTAASRKRIEWPGTPSSQIASSGWIVGQTQLTLPMSVLPELGSGPWSAMPYAAAFATQRASRVAFWCIDIAPPEYVTSTVDPVASAAASASAEKRA